MTTNSSRTLVFHIDAKSSICWPKITLAMFADSGDAAWELNTQSNKMIINSSQQMDHCNELTRNLQRNMQSSCWDASLVYWDGRSLQSLQDHLKQATYFHSSVIGLVFKMNYLMQQKNAVRIWGIWYLVNRNSCRVTWLAVMWLQTLQCSMVHIQLGICFG